MLQHELKNTINIVREAGGLLLKYYQRDYNIEFKKGDGPVTQADKASNEFIVKQLTAHYPNDGILSEESADDYSRLKKKRVWLVDPMDGTREFIDKNGQFVVMIGLVLDGVPVLGVVYQPTTEKLYYAMKESGAFLIHNQNTSPLTVADTENVPEMSLVVSRSHRSKLLDDIMKVLHIQEDVRSGSVGLKVGLLVEKKAELYIHPNSKTKEWDTCAPQVILEEAGGRITDCLGGPLRYNKKDVYNSHGYIASNGQAHSEIVQKISSFVSRMD